MDLLGRFDELEHLPKLGFGDDANRFGIGTQRGEPLRQIRRRQILFADDHQPDVDREFVDQFGSARRELLPRFALRHAGELADDHGAQARPLRRGTIVGSECHRAGGPSSRGTRGESFSVSARPAGVNRPMEPHASPMKKAQGPRSLGS